MGSLSSLKSIESAFYQASKYEEYIDLLRSVKSSNSEEDRASTVAVQSGSLDVVQYLVQKLGKDCLKDENNSRDNAFNASSATYGKRFISDRIEKQKKIIDYLFLISPDEMNHCDKYGYNIFTTSVQEGEQEITNYLKERYGINMEHSKGLLKINLFYPVITKEVSSLKRIKYVIKSLMSEGYEGKDGDDAMIIAHYYCNDKEKKGRS